MCVNCHTPIDKLGLGRTLDALTAIIHSTMPVLSPAECADSCASDVAAYIAVTDPYFGKDPNDVLGERFDTVDEPVGTVDPAPVILTRLNRTQYNNTVRDLLGTSLTPADNFPEDSAGYGHYDTIAGSLSVSLTHVEQYLAAAKVLAEEAVSGTTGARIARIEAETQRVVNNSSVEGNLLSLRATGSQMITDFTVPTAGSYAITIRAGQDAAENEPANMVVAVDGVEIGSADVAVPRTAMMNYTFTTSLSAGAHTLVVEFTNDVFVEGVLNRNLVLDWVEIGNPNAVAGVEVIPCDMAAGLTCARQFIDQFGVKAWRRPLSTQEKTDLTALYQEAKTVGGSEQFAFEQLVRGFLLAPHFMYRPELDANLQAMQPRMLNPYELASRLSYFLWSSMPDKQLFDRAADGTLTNETVLRSEVRRMLADTKANALVDNFFTQWLGFKNAKAPAPELFPDFDPATVELMQQETRLFITELLKSNAPIDTIVTADFSYLNEALARHYGVSGVSGNDFVKYEWDDAQRRGILGQGSFLTANAHPTVTSLVKRGVWVLEALICKKPPDPPQGVNTEVVLDPTKSAREVSEMHRDSSTVCFGCHAMMDPIGYGLENFDSAGQWRVMDGPFPVDASGILPGGIQFNGPVQLAEVIGGSPRLPLCVVDHMMTYALGRGLEALNDTQDLVQGEARGYATAYDVYKKASTSGFRIHSIIEEIVLSPAFRMRRGAESGEI